MKRFVVRMMLVAMVGATALAACGDDDGGGAGDEPTDGGTLSEEGYIDAADEICANQLDAIDEASDEVSDEVSDDDLDQEEAAELLVEEVLPIVRASISEIRSLEGPEDLTEDVHELLDESEAVLDDLEEDPTIILEDTEPLMAVDAGFAALGFDDCGGDAGDDGTTDDTTDGTDDDTLTEDEFVEAGDEICAASDEAAEDVSDDLEAEFSDDPDAPEDEIFERIVEEIVPLVRDTVEQFRELEGPPDLTADVNEILDDIEEAADEIEADPSILGDDEDPFGDFDERWSDLGFEECGSDD